MSTDFSCVDDEKMVYWHLGQRMSTRYSFGYSRDDFAGHENAAELICEHLNYGKSLRIVLTDDIPDGYKEIKICDHCDGYGGTGHGWVPQRMAGSQQPPSMCGYCDGTGVDK